LNDNERLKPTETLHFFIAIRRKKENRDKQELVFRQIIRNEPEDLDIIKTRISHHSGTWRIYKTVNARSVTKALKIFQHQLLDNPEQFKYRIDYLWRTCLLKREARAEKKFHVDIDVKDISKIMDVKEYLLKEGVEILEEIGSPNGYHLVTTPFNRQKFKIENVEVNPDGYIFVDKIIVDDEK